MYGFVVEYIVACVVVVEILGAVTFTGNSESSLSSEKKSYWITLKTQPAVTGGPMSHVPQLFRHQGSTDSHWPSAAHSTQVP